MDWLVFAQNSYVESLTHVMVFVHGPLGGNYYYSFGLGLMPCRIFHCSALTLWLWLSDSVVVAHWLSCSKACGILVPWPGMEPESLALQHRFLTIGPPGKLLYCFLKGIWNLYFSTSCSPSLWLKFCHLKYSNVPYPNPFSTTAGVTMRIGRHQVMTRKRTPC